MDFWKRLFKNRLSKKSDQADWDEEICARDETDFNNEEQRTSYILNCLEQMSETSREINMLMGEYSLVTAYLTDMEEIEALAETEREKINSFARHLDALEAERAKYLDSKERMSDREYAMMSKQEEDVQEGVKRLKKEEEYSKRVKEDLKRLSRERHAYQYRKEELHAIQVNLKGMAMIFLISLILCVFMLLILQFVFKMRTEVGYFLSFSAATIAIVVLCIKYLDVNKECMRVENAINRLILLQNKVKIRYVNNVNLLDYLYMKYNTSSATKLEKLWKRYEKEKEERKQYEEAESRISYYAKQLVEQLSRYRVAEPSRWVHQTKALLDPREMVEIRHELILRRQALRKQMDYNKEVSATAKDEIMDVVNQFPMYSGEILELVNRYEEKEN